MREDLKAISLGETTHFLYLRKGLKREYLWKNY